MSISFFHFYEFFLIFLVFLKITGQKSYFLPKVLRFRDSETVFYSFLSFVLVSLDLVGLRCYNYFRLNFVNNREANISHLRSKYFTAKRFHPTESDFTVGEAHLWRFRTIRYFALCGERPRLRLWKPRAFKKARPKLLTVQHLF